MKKKLVFLLCMTALFVMAMATGVLAADTSYDMTAAVTTTVGELTEKFWALVAVIVPGVMLIVGGKLVITKGIGWFKALAGKA